VTLEHEDKMIRAWNQAANEFGVGGRHYNSPHIGRIRPTDLIVDDDANSEYHLNQDEFLRMVERNKKTELERRKWRKWRNLT
jgi:hypothetical protein